MMYSGNSFEWAYEQMKMGKRVRRREWPVGGYVVLGIGIIHEKDFIAKDWELYEEPKQKVKKWIWEYIKVNGSGNFIFLTDYMTDFEAHCYFSPLGVKNNKIKWTEKEFDQ